QHERHRPPRQAALDDLEGPNVDDRLVLGIEGMEMRRLVVAPEHLDKNAVKRADGRHQRHIARILAAKSTRGPSDRTSAGCSCASGHVSRSKCFKSGGGMKRVRAANTER